MPALISPEFEYTSMMQANDKERVLNRMLTALDGKTSLERLLAQDGGPGSGVPGHKTVHPLARPNNTGKVVRPQYEGPVPRGQELHRALEKVGPLKMDRPTNTGKVKLQNVEKYLKSELEKAWAAEETDGEATDGPADSERVKKAWETRRRKAAGASKWGSASKHRTKVDPKEKQEITALLKRASGEHSPETVEKGKEHIAKAAAAAPKSLPFWEDPTHPAYHHQAEVKLEKPKANEHPDSNSVNEHMKRVLSGAKPAQKGRFKALLHRILYGKDGAILSARDAAYARGLLRAVDRNWNEDAEWDESKVNRAENGEFRAKAIEDAHFAHLGAQNANGMAHYPTAAARARKLSKTAHAMSESHGSKREKNASTSAMMSQSYKGTPRPLMHQNAAERHGKAAYFASQTGKGPERDAPE